MTARTRLRGALVSVVAALALGACGAPEEAAPPAPTPAPASPSPEPSPIPPARPPAECVDATIEGDPVVELVAVDYRFEPECLVVLGGQSLEISNEGTVVHNFSIEGTLVDVDTPPGESTSTEALGGVLEPGTHEFVCSYHEAQGMFGEITVSAAG